MKHKPLILIALFHIGTLFAWTGVLVAQPFPPRLERGVDRPGGDFRDFDLQKSDPKLCRSACINDKRCRAWTYVKPGHQGLKARCWLKTVASRPRSGSCCTSGFINVLKQIQACREIGNIKGQGSVKCIGPGGRNFGKAGKTFKKGDKVMILARFHRLHLGGNELSAVYSRAKGGKFVNFSKNKRVLKFKNKSGNWAFWFPAHFTKEGRWRVSLALKGKGLTGQVLGQVEYCVNCPLG